MDRVAQDRSRRNLTAEELSQLNDNWCEVGCGCDRCRPDLHDAAEQARGDAETAEVAA